MNAEQEDAESRPAAPGPGAPGKAAIVGSRGRMGEMLLRRARAAGLDVSGVDQPLTEQALKAALAGADLALLCVPAAVFAEVAKAVTAQLAPGAVLADITSVKERPLRQMEHLWHGPVVGTHPLFGPKSAPGADQPVAVVAGKGAEEAHLARVEGFFTALGCRTFRCSAAAHDRAMARIQNTNFITNLAYFALLAGEAELLPFLTPSFERRRAAAAKMLTEDAELFSGLFEANAHSLEAVRQYRKMLNVAAAGDIDLLCHRAAWWWEEGAGAATGAPGVDTGAISPGAACPPEGEKAGSPGGAGRPGTDPGSRRKGPRRGCRRVARRPCRSARAMCPAPGRGAGAALPPPGPAGSLGGAGRSLARRRAATIARPPARSRRPRAR